MTNMNFSMVIEHTVRDRNLSYMDSVVYLCDEYEIELESLKSSLSDNIKEKISLEAKKLNMMKDNDIPISLF